jgi:hypothetical protein
VSTTAFIKQKYQYKASPRFSLRKIAVIDSPDLPAPFSTIWSLSCFADIASPGKKMNPEDISFGCSDDRRDDF